MNDGSCRRIVNRTCCGLFGSGAARARGAVELRTRLEARDIVELRSRIGGM